MEHELFDSDNTLKELEEAEVLLITAVRKPWKTSNPSSSFKDGRVTSNITSNGHYCDGSVAKPGSMLSVAIFDPWQRSLSSCQRTPGKEPLLAGNPSSKLDSTNVVYETACLCRELYGKVTNCKKTV